MATSNPSGPRYGEKGARMKSYPQRHQAPIALQTAVGNDKTCMEMCPSPGLHVDKLGDRADPLPPERKRNYEKKKARIQAARVAAIRSKKDRVEGRRKTVAKKVKNTAPPPEQPPPLLTVFPTAPAPPVPHLPTAPSTPPEEPRASSSFLSSSRYATRPASVDVDEAYQPPPTAKNDQKHNALDSTHYFEFYATPQTGHAPPTHIRSPASMPSLESDRGTPSTIQSPPSPYPVAEREGRAPAEEDVDSEELFNTVYQSFFIPRSSWSHPSPALEQGSTNAPTVVPKTAHAPCDLMKPVPYFLPYPPPSQPAFMDLLGAHTRDSTTMGTAIRTSRHQGGHSGHSYMPAATTSSVIQSQQRRGRPKKGASRTTGTPGLRRPERATFDHQRAPRPYPSHSDRVAGGHALLNRSLATPEDSAATGRTNYEVTPPITAVGTRQAQVQQPDGSAIGGHALHDNGRHLSTRSSSSHAHTIHTSSMSPAGMTSTPLVDSVNQHRSNVPGPMDAPKRPQPARTSISAYSELAHALVDQPSVALPTMQAGVCAWTVHASLYAPQVRSGAIASPTMNAPGTLAYNAHWPQNDLLIASHPALASSGIDAAAKPNTSRAHAANNGDTARTFEGRFEECEPFWPSVIVPLLGKESATGQSLDGTYLGEPSAGSQSHLRQQFLTTSTWHETYAELSYPYPPSTVLCSTSSFTAAAMQGLRE